VEDEVKMSTGGVYTLGFTAGFLLAVLAAEVLSGQLNALCMFA
jgi:hypothetical protein